MFKDYEVKWGNEGHMRFPRMGKTVGIVLG